MFEKIFSQESICWFAVKLFGEDRDTLWGKEIGGDDDSRIVLFTGVFELFTLIIDF